MLYCRQTALLLVGKGNVFRVDGGRARQMTAFPRPLTDYGIPVPGDLPPGFPDAWIDQDRTEGNNATAILADNGQTLRGTTIVSRGTRLTNWRHSPNH